MVSNSPPFSLKLSPAICPSLLHASLFRSPQSCPTLCNPIGYTVSEILQARILERVAFPFSRGPSQPRDQTQVSGTAGRSFTSWATREALRSPSLGQKAVLPSQDSTFSLHWSAPQGALPVCCARHWGGLGGLSAQIPRRPGTTQRTQRRHMVIICWL